MDATFVSLSGLSDRTGLSVAWLQTEATAGRLPFIWVGRSRMFPVDTVVALLARRAVTESATTTKRGAGARRDTELGVAP